MSKANKKWYMLLDPASNVCDFVFAANKNLPELDTIDSKNVAMSIKISSRMHDALLAKLKAIGSTMKPSVYVRSLIEQDLMED